MQSLAVIKKTLGKEAALFANQNSNYNRKTQFLCIWQYCSL